MTPLHKIKTKVVKKRKPITVAYLRNDVLWKLVSKFVRLTAAVKENDNGHVHCVTCGERKHYKQLQAGHFIPGRYNAIIFETRGIHPQCYHCNVGLKGNPRKYDEWMRKNMGDKVVEELDALAKDTRQFFIPELLGMIGEYKKKVDELLAKLVEIEGV